MKRLLLFAFLLFSFNAIHAQCPSGTDQIAFHDGDSEPAGWTVDDQRGGYWLLSDNAGSTPAGEGVISAPIDVSAYNTITINMEVATFGSGTARPGVIEFSTNGGTSYDANTFTTATPTNSSYIDGGDFTFTVPANTTNLVIRLSREDSGIGRDVRARNLYICGSNVVTDPTVSFVATASSITEGNSGTTIHMVEVTMNTAPTLAVTVDVTDSGNGDADNADFSYSATQLTFQPAPIETYPNTKTVDVTINGDEIVELDETVELALAIAASSVGTADLGNTMHTITITNDDAPTEVNLSSTTLGVAEGGSVQLCVDIANPSNTNITTADIVLTSAGTPHFDGYTTQSVSFAAGSSTQQCVTLATDAANSIADSNHSYTFDLQNVAGGNSAIAVSPTQATVTVFDDTAPALAKGLYINEFSNGTGGGEEFVELVVTGTAGETVDLRGWIVDDNNGDFGSGGIADGHLRFSQDCNWENVPVGAMILLYNAGDKNISISLADDITDANLDLTYICPIKTAGAGGNAPYFEGNTAVPSSGSSAYTTTILGSPAWGDISLGNSVDASQVRMPDGTLVHGAAYGSGNNGSANNFPYFSGSGSGQNYSFTNDAGDDFTAQANWTKAAASSGDTPGAFNNAANQAYIEGLRDVMYPVESTNKTRTCELGANQSRFYFGEEDGNDIILFIQNNSTTDYGSSTASVNFSGSYNENMADEAYQFPTIWQFTPTNSTPANYTIRFYVPQSDWDAYVAYLNGLPNSDGDHTAASVLNECQIFTYNDADSPATAASTDAQSPTTSTYSAGGVDYYTLEATFTHFSQFAIGLGAAFLPVELIDFSAKKTDKSDIQVTWKTATEINNDYFLLERSSDGERFEEIAKIKGQGTIYTNYSYQFLDNAPINGINYYRLKQVDLDGQFAYSEIISEKIGSQTTISVRPNLVKNEMTVELDEISKTDILLEIYDLQGRLVLTNQIEQGATAINLELIELPQGTYVLKANDGGAISVIQFVKL